MKLVHNIMGWDRQGRGKRVKLDSFTDRTRAFKEMVRYKREGNYLGVCIESVPA